MRSHKVKAGLLFFAVLVALGGMGGAFAHWTDSVEVREIVGTGTLEWRTSGPTCDLEWQGTCEETAWAMCDGGGCFECPSNWGRYFRYHVGDAALVLPFVAGQHTLIGNVTVSTQDGNLIVEYDTTASGWPMELSQLYVDKTKPDKCAPGQFPFRSDADSQPPDDTQYSKQISDYVHRYTIPLSTIGAGPCEHVYVAAHADVTTSDCVADCGTCSASVSGHTVVVRLLGVQEGCAGDLCFLVQNTGSIPIHITDIVCDLGCCTNVDMTLLTAIIGEQLHPGESRVCCMSMSVGSPVVCTDCWIVVTVKAIQWNLD